MRPSLRIKRAYISVQNTEHLIEFAEALRARHIELFATAESWKLLRKMGFPVALITLVTEIPPGTLLIIDGPKREKPLVLSVANDPLCAVLTAKTDYHYVAADLLQHGRLSDILCHALAYKARLAYCDESEITLLGKLA